MAGAGRIVSSGVGGEFTPRLLFVSYHCYVDPSSGAAVASQDLLELLADRGWAVRVFCGPTLDFGYSEPLSQLLASHGMALLRRECHAGRISFSLYYFRHGDVAGAIYWPAKRQHRAPSREEGHPFLALFDRLLARFRPQILLTYGGHWLAVQTMRMARRRGVRVVFALHNFEYRERRLFELADAILVPSEFCAEWYRRTLGLRSVAVPSPFNWSRVCCPRQEQDSYVTFVNPQPNKGVFVFARIAYDLGRRRPDIPLLVVEGRGGVDWLGRTEVDLRGLENLSMMFNTHDPRGFYSVTRMVVMPSLCNESFGRVAAEAMINGIPVLASRRGALPEVIQGAGFLFDIPKHYAPHTRAVPRPEEVMPWIKTIIRLWDDKAFYEEQSNLVRAAAQAWHPDRLAPRYDTFFRSVLRGNCPRPLEKASCGGAELTVPDGETDRQRTSPDVDFEV